VNNAYRLLTIAVLAVLMVESHRGMKTWSNPVVFYAGPFAVILVLQQILIPGVPFGGRAASLIGGSALAFFAGAIVIWRRHATKGAHPSYRRLIAPDARLLKFGVFVSYAVALYYLYELRLVRASGVDVLNDVFYRADFYASGGQTLTLRLLQALTYVGVFYIAFAAITVRRRTLILAPMVLIMVAQSSASSSKLPTILTLELIVAVLAAVRPEAFGRLRPRLILGAGAAIAITLLVFSLVTNDRSRGTGDVVATTEYAMLGSPSALSELLDGHQTVNEPDGFGASFGGIVSALGGPQRTFGVYAASVQLTPGLYQSETNVYTWFVPLRHDFGMAGTLGLIGLLGSVLTSLFMRAREGLLGVPGLSVLALGDLTLMFAPLNTLTYYNVWFILLGMALPLSLVFRLVDVPAAIEDGNGSGQEGNAGRTTDGLIQARVLTSLSPPRVFRRSRPGQGHGDLDAQDPGREAQVDRHHDGAQVQGARAH
jgi:oligosaccharide repeat unit polymerase